eukprot:CAMPEP_0174820776 /NCGR_PEP_ID=MMETSP1107-20130205/4812_1 /TAXON_ID=36770 /ORGANISM="Paraphysomonas vestita, Strain GFlagA" /LENGTH=274 /DNA_ID=CAMNT_0016036743 /DNA_START=882 /DNA_END=1706 /DNA_ORIENTATION=-
MTGASVPMNSGYQFPMMYTIPIPIPFSQPSNTTTQSNSNSDIQQQSQSQSQQQQQPITSAQNPLSTSPTAMNPYLHPGAVPIPVAYYPHLFNQVNQSNPNNNSNSNNSNNGGNMTTISTSSSPIPNSNLSTSPLLSSNLASFTANSSNLSTGSQLPPSQQLQQPLLPQHMSLPSPAISSSNTSSIPMMIPSMMKPPAYGMYYGSPPGNGVFGQYGMSPQSVGAYMLSSQQQQQQQQLQSQSQLHPQSSPTSTSNPGTPSGVESIPPLAPRGHTS